MSGYVRALRVSIEPCSKDRTNSMVATMRIVAGRLNVEGMSGDYS